jgi:hypothetical protein
MEKGMSLTHPMEWEATVSEATVDGEAVRDGGIRFFRGVILAVLISLPFWGAAAWLALSWAGR